MIYKLLILDDEPLIVKGLVNMISEIEFSKDIKVEILKDYSASKALDTMQKTPIDIVLSDINMPGMSGLEFQKEIKKCWPKCRIIFLTGYDVFNYIHEAMRNEAIDYILKSENEDYIKNTVKKAILMLVEESYRERIENSKKEMFKLSEKSFENGFNKKIKQIEAYIEEHIGEELTLQTLSEQFHFNPSYLSRQFKLYKGRGLIEYITEQRIGRAKKLLLEGHYKIYDISRMVGFETGTYFSRVFKKYTGLNPQEFREHFELESKKGTG